MLISRQLYLIIASSKKTDFTGSNITGVSFQNCKISQTILDLEGIIQYGLSKGFVLSQT
jgi:hypothetical protein